jgi:hypothetical protein
LTILILRGVTPLLLLLSLGLVIEGDCRPCPEAEGEGHIEFALANRLDEGVEGNGDVLGLGAEGGGVDGRPGEEELP